MDLRDSTGRQELGRRIQAAVAGAGYASLSAFADELGCSRALIYQYVNGDVLAQLDRLQTIGELTNRPLDWFVQTDPAAASAEAQEAAEALDEATGRADELQAALSVERGARLREQGRHREAMLATLRELCRALRRAGDAQTLLETAQRLRSLADDANDEPSEMVAQLRISYAAYELGDAQTAREAATKARELARKHGNTAAEASAQQELVRALQASGHLEEARAQAMQLREADDWWPRWSSLVSLAAMAEQMGGLADAEAHLDEAEGVASEAQAPEDRRRLAETYIASNRVNILLARGRYEEALKRNRRFGDDAARAGLPDQVREAAANEAICHLRLGQLDAAAEDLGRLRDWATHAGDQRLAILAQVLESERLRRAGDATEAKRMARAAVGSANEGSSGQLVAEAELALAQAYLAEGLVDDATYYLERCEGRAERLGFRRLAVTARLARARAALADEAPDASERLAQVSRVARDHGYEDLREQAADARTARDDGNEGE